MKNEKYKKAYKLYQQGYSLQDVGNEIGVTRQAVYAAFKVRGYKMRIKKFLPFIIYDDLKWTINSNGYYRCTIRKQKEQLLQRYKWEKEKGKIPKGWDIHHIDFDKTNNDIKNLECLSKEEHTSQYSPHHNQYKNNKTKHLYEKNKGRVFKKDGTRYEKTN